MLLWSAFHNSLPTLTNLQHRNISIPGRTCKLCDTEDEDTDHLWFHCSYTRDIWCYFIKAFNISWCMHDNLQHNFEAWDLNVLSGRCNTLWKWLPYAVIYATWKERNARVFQGKKKQSDDIILEVKALLVLWASTINLFNCIPV
ncbi:hypothetical protein MKW92_021237, partial [Papaver armeniacum]